MGWSTELFCNISFNRKTFNSKYEVEEELEDTKKYLETAKSRLRNIAMITEPKKFCDDDDDPICWLDNEITNTLELIEEYTIDIFKLRRLLENWEQCHNKEGLAIDPPSYDVAYLCGDFVKSEKYPE